MNLLEDLAKALSDTGAEPVHLTVANMAGTFDVIALASNGGRVEGFPIPPELHHGITCVAKKRNLSPAWMHASFSMIVAQEKLPEDFFAEEDQIDHGPVLRVSRLGRAGLKYLALFEAVHRASSPALEELKKLELKPSELLKITRWVRTEGILENRHGYRLTEVLSALTPET